MAPVISVTVPSAFSDTEVSGNLDQLSSLDKLTWLDLTNTDITDESLVALNELAGEQLKDTIALTAIE